jgi:nucleotide-binding universal stress UspA family protein
MRFKKVLFHTRFREMAFECLQSILELKAAGLEEVVLAYVIAREDVAFVPYGGYLRDHENELRQKAMAQFETWREAVEKYGLKATVTIEVGTATASVLDIAEAHQVDLIVTGPKKRTLMEHIYVGRHILDVLRRSPVPVLMAKHQAEVKTENGAERCTNTEIFKRPLLATDWSQPSRNTLGALKGIKNVIETVLLVHVIRQHLLQRADGAELERLESESRSRLADYKKQLTMAGLKVETHLAHGHTVTEILNLSRAQCASMIVMGRSGKDWFEEYWLGGVTHRVAEHSELPVMVVP